MLSLFKKYKYSCKKKIKKLFLGKKEIKKLSKEGHIIGLHSHSHPANLSKLKYNEQMNEYKKNKKILEKIVNKNIISMSHPCGDYNNNTLKILKKLNVLMGFRSNMSFNKKNLINNNNLEVAREDCSNILNKI